MQMKTILVPSRSLARIKHAVPRRPDIATMEKRLVAQTASVPTMSVGPIAMPKQSVAEMLIPLVKSVL